MNDSWAALSALLRCVSMRKQSSSDWAGCRSTVGHYTSRATGKIADYQQIASSLRRRWQLRSNETRNPFYFSNSYYK